MLIYKIAHKLDGKSYIGQTVGIIEKRWQQHLSETRGGSYYPIHCAIRKYGSDAFEIETICECESKEDMDAVEKFCIIAFNTKKPNGYNLTDGGEGWSGARHSPETRKRIGELNTRLSLPTRNQRKTSPYSHGTCFFRRVNTKNERSCKRKYKRYGY